MAASQSEATFADAISDIKGLQNSIGQTATGMIGIVAWVVIVTVCLVVLAIVTYRKWRRENSSYDTGSTGQSAASVEFGEGSLSGSLTSINTAVGQDNAAYDDTHVDMSPPSSMTNLSMMSGGSEAAVHMSPSSSLSDPPPNFRHARAASTQHTPSPLNNVHS